MESTALVPIGGPKIGSRSWKRPWGKRWSYPNARSIRSRPFFIVSLRLKPYLSTAVNDLPSDHRTQPSKKATTRVKKRPTRKHLFISDDQRRILALSPPAPGSHHDYAMFKEWQPPDQLPDGVIYWTDSGFQGLRTDYPQCPVIQPQKKPRGKKLNDLDQWCNALRARIRIVVEHAIGGVKRFGAIAQTYRNRGADFEDRLTLVACGLWNWHLQQAD
jgi:hypothetical protein